MAKKLRDIVSEIATDLKASLNLDDRITYRFLAEKFRSKIAYFLRQDAKSRELLKDFTIWKAINCVCLEDIAASTCGYIDEFNTLKRSVIQIPEAYNTNYGQLVKVFTVDGFREFTMIKSIDYADYINRQYTKPKNVFWIENKYIFVPNIDIETVKVLIIAKEPIEVDKLNCTVDKCTSPLDGEINYPDYLITLAKKEVMVELIGGYKKIIEDEKGDDNSNRKQ